MLPWFLCLLTTTVLSPSVKTLSSNEIKSEDSILWKPSTFSKDSLPPGFKIYQGDILLPENENLKNAIKTKTFLWEKGLIPFEFGDNFTCSEKNTILDAMSVLEEKTCIKFTEKDDEKTYIRFQNKQNGCFAPIGRLPGNEGPLPVNLESPGCFKEIGTVEHELLHVAGLFHEQSRPDRDEHVTIHWCNIQSSYESNFNKGTEKEMDTFGLPYDFESIMHYPRFAFSKNGRPTISAKGNPKMKLGQREAPSAMDIEKVNKMYGCKA